MRGKFGSVDAGRLVAVGVGVALAALTLGGVAWAQALKTPQEVAAGLAKRFGVQVLGIERVDADGKPAYAARVMAPGGNTNYAYLVSTLVVDAASGELIPQFRHHTSGYSLGGDDLRRPVHDASGETIRRESLR